LDPLGHLEAACRFRDGLHLVEKKALATPIGARLHNEE
jgi:hypothetical protein